MVKQADSQDLAAAQRRCIVSGASGPRGELIRFVASPKGEVVPDVEGKLPGRGVWLSARRKALDEAVRRNPFSHALRQKVTVGADLTEATERLLLRRTLDLLTLARRAGQAEFGAERVSERIADVRMAEGVLLTARDARVAAHKHAPRGMRIVDALTVAELGQAFGRARVATAFVAPGRLADRLVTEGVRLAGVRLPAA